MRTKKTHFDQIPIESVKNIVGDPATWIEIRTHDAAHGERAQHSSRCCRDASQKRDDGMSRKETWRDIAEKIQEESDPAELVDLVQLLIDKWDEEKQSKNP